MATDEEIKQIKDYSEVLDEIIWQTQKLLDEMSYLRSEVKYTDLSKINQEFEDSEYSPYEVFDRLCYLLTDVNEFAQDGKCSWHCWVNEQEELLRRAAETESHEGGKAECPYCHEMTEWLWWDRGIQEGDTDEVVCSHCNRTFKAHFAVHYFGIYAEPIRDED